MQKQEALDVIARALSQARLNHEKWDEEDGYILNGCVALYRSTKDKRYVDILKNYIDARISSDGEVTFGLDEDSKEDLSRLDLGRVLTFLYEETGDSKYKVASDRLKNIIVNAKRDEDGIIMNKGTVSIGIFAKFMPFYIEYETFFNKKNGYNDVCKQFEVIRDKYFDESKNVYSVQEFDSMENILFAKSLVDSLDAMSIQIYEDYDLLLKMLKKSARGLIDIKESSMSDREKALVSYILNKSICRKHISYEKYAPFAKRLFEDLFEKDFTDDKVMLGAVMMALAYRI